MKTKAKFIFERRHIEECEFQILLDAFNPDEMSPENLKLFCGSVKVTVGGYAECPERPFRVRELRIFLRELGKVWRPGAAAFFCDVNSAFFSLYLVNQLDNVIIVERDRTNDYFVRCRAAELEPIFAEACRGIAELGHRAGQSKKVIERRQKHFAQEVLTIFKFDNK